MSRNRQRYFISIDPDIETKQKMPIVSNNNRNNLHLTMSYLGELDRSQLREIDRKLSGIKQKNKQFKVKYNDVSDFNDRFLHAKVKPTRRLKSLYSDIYTDIGDKTRHTYNPHITLAPHMGVKDIQSPPKLKGSFNADRVILYRINENNKTKRYEKVKSYKLKDRNILDRIVDFFYE